MTSTVNKVFRIPFNSSERLRPSKKDLEVHLGGLEGYRTLLAELDAFVRLPPQAAAQRDIREQMFYGMLSHTRFVNPFLLSAVELYHHHLRSLSSLELEKLTDFIRTSEKEIGRLNVKKLDDVIRMGRLQEMIAGRRKLLAPLMKQWSALTAELQAIATYIRDNLFLIEKLCDSSLVILSDIEIRGRREKQLIEDIKAHVKNQLRSALQHRLVTQQDLQAAKKQLDAIAREMTILIREDVQTSERLYEEVQARTKKTAQKMHGLLAAIKNSKKGSLQEVRELYARGGNVLVTLLMDFNQEPVPVKASHLSKHELIILKIRKKMFDYLFDLAQKERRARRDRRTIKDRRVTIDPAFKGPEQRKNAVRRMGPRRGKPAADMP